METELAITNEDQLRVVMKLEEVLKILKHTPIKNKESLKYIDKPLDDLLSSLRYLPADPPFSFLPTEIKTDILGYLCNSGTLVASSVCQEWKMILAPRVNKLDQVILGKHCSNEYECEGGKCYIPEAMLKALMTLELDIPLSVCHPLTHVDPQVVSEGLATTSSLSIIGDCTDCLEDDYDEPILTNEQKEQLLVCLEIRREIMELMQLRSTDLNNLDQDRLVNVLINKNSTLILDEGDYGPFLDIKKFVKKINALTDFELFNLDLNNVQYPDDLAKAMADALCLLPVVNLHPHFPLKIETIERLLENILTRSTETLCLRIYVEINWSTLIDPDALKTMVDKMDAVELQGTFTSVQLQAARSCPGVKVNSFRIDSISKRYQPR